MKTLKRTLAMLLVLCMVLGFVPFGAFAAATTGTTQNQPFPSGTAYSTHFRIPAITTLSNGDLLAAADARWNDYYDKGNIDTLVSISKDNGANWEFSFANYIADYSDSYDIQAATFIDPAMAVKTVDGVETIYMLVDLFPGQASGSTMCITAALAGTGMDENGHLLVSDKNDNTVSDLNHYVGDFDENNMATLYTSAGDDSGYDVDAWFNVYDSNNEKLGNLFTYGDTPFFVYQTSYLYLTKSTDGGKTWSAPTLINNQVKDSSEKFYGVGPASGIVTSDGTIMYTCYTYNGGDGKTSTIYSKDNGVTWERGADLNSQSSEAALANGNNGIVYLFNRYGQVCYTSDYGESWSYLGGVGYATGCEVSAMTYSKPIDGQTAILVCGPTSGRYGGKIFVGLVNDDNSITWKYNYAVNNTSDPFQYSAMTELADGSIGLLYENTVNTTTGMVFENIAITDVIGENGVIGTPEKTINMTVGEEKTFTLDEVVDSGSHTSDAADITWTKNDTTISVPAAQLGTDISYSGDTIDLNDCLYTFTKNSDGTWLISADVNGNTIYVDPYVYNNAGYPNRTYETNVTLSVGDNNTVNFKDNTADSTGRTGYLHFWDDSSTNLYWDNCTSNNCTGHDLLVYKVADTSSDTVLGGYFQQVSLSELVSGEKYLIVGHTISGYDSNGYYAMHPSASSSDKWSHVAKITGGFTDITTSETTVEIEAKAAGATSVVIGSTKYTINVSTALDNVVDVELMVDGIFTDTLQGVYVESGSTENDIVSVSWVGTEATSSYATATLGNDANYNGSAINVVDCLYTFTASGSGFVVQSKANPNVYLNTTKNSAGYPNATESNVVNLSAGNTENSFYMLCNPQNGENSNKLGYLHFYRNGNNRFDRVDNTANYRPECSFYLYRPAGDDDVSSTEIPGYVRVTAAYNEVTNGDYLIAAEYSGAYYLLHPSTSTSDKYAHVAKVTGQTAGTDTPASTEITITAKAEGTTSVEIGSTLYNITVEEASDHGTVDVELDVNETSDVFTDNTGNHENNISKQPDVSIATMIVTGTDASIVNKQLVPVTSTAGLVAGKQYVLECTRTANSNHAAYQPNNSVLTSTEESNGLLMDGPRNAETSQVWQIIPNGNNFQIVQNGEYVKLDNLKATMESDPSDLTFEYVANNGWLIYQNGYYLSDVYGVNNTHAFGYSSRNDDGNYWTIYEVTGDSVPAKTEITFTGVTPGNTTAVVGGTTYNITVTQREQQVEVPLYVGETKTFSIDGVAYTDADVKKAENADSVVLTEVTDASVNTRELIPATEIKSGTQYVIKTGRADRTERTMIANAVKVSDSKYGIELADSPSGETMDWTITAVNGGYTISNGGKNVRIDGNNMATLAADAVVQIRASENTSYGNGYWEIYSIINGNNYYLNYFDSFGNASSSGCAAAVWNDNDSGSQWKLYEVVTEEKISTDVTFTGLTVGETQVTVGNVNYNITVSVREEALAAYVGATVSVTPNGTVTEADITAFNEAHGDNVTVELVDGKLVFTGVTADTTATAKLGNVIYNITVKESEERNITLYVGVTLNDFIDGFSYGNTQSTQPDNTYAYIHSVTTENGGTKVVFSGVAATPEGQVITANVGHVIYNITVKELHSGEDVPGFNCVIGEGQYASGASGVENLSGKEVKSLRITAGAEFNLGVDITDADSIKWVSSNPDAATVDDTGKITAVEEGTTLVTAEVTKDGVTESISVHVTVVPSMVEGYDDSEISHVVYYIDQVYNTDPFYTMFLSSENSTGPVEEHTMVMVMEGEVLYFERPNTAAFAMVWTSDPWDGYALTTMGATNTRGEYFPLQSDEGVLGSGGIYYKGSDPYNNIINYGNAAGADWQAAFDELLEYNVHVGQDIWEDFGCDGAMSMSRLQNDGGPNLATSLSFVSEKLPEVSKSINGVMPSTTEKDESGNDVIRCKLADWQVYEDGLYARVGDFLYFTINVRIEAPHSWELDTSNNVVNDAYGPLAALKYNIGADDGATLTDDVLPGAYFYTKELDGQDGNRDGVAGDNDDGYIINEALKKTTQDITDDLNRGWTDDEIAAGYRNLEYYVVYRIQENDENKKVVNSVKLDYTFKSAYSAGTKNASSNAEASLYVLGQSLQDLVIDFGLPVSFTVTRDDLAHTFDVDKSNKAQGGCLYGTISMVQTAGADTTDVTTDDEWTITYTPNKILQNYDVVYLLDSQGDLQNFFRVYPATTVYYEEGFLFTGNVTGNWQPDEKNMGTGPQQTEMLGYKRNETYGYDDHYANHSTGSDNSSASSTAVGDKTVFTFTGSGFDLYANSNSGSGYVTLYSEGKLSKIYMIDTKLTDLDGDILEGTYYSLPIISEKNLPYGEYTVYLMHSNDSAPISIDGIRIINTIEDSQIFLNDEEDDPVFYELRDYVLNAIDVEKLTESDYVDTDDRVAKVEEVSQMAGQVYNAMSEGTKAVVINEDGTSFKSGEAQKLLDNGPKNELYLYPGQTLAFSVTTKRVLQLGLKSPVGSADFTLTVDGVKHDLDTLTTTVDMFYKIADKAETETEHTVSITVNDGVLSVTTLKICDDPNFTFNTLTQEDVENVLLGIYGLNDVETPDEPVNPFEDVASDAFYYDAVLWAVNNGITNGTDATHFAPNGICNRAQVVTFLWRAMGEPEPTTTVNPFEDVASDAFYYDAVLWAYENGITTGVDATHFNPTGECNRAQVITFLWRAVGKPESETVVDFEDVQPGQFYSDAVAWAVENGVTNGVDGVTFGALATCNRAQVVTFLYRSCAPK